MKLTAVSTALATLLLAATATAGTFIVPADEELVGKAGAIVIGTVESSYPQQNGNTIETVNEIRVDRTLKGPSNRGALVRVVTLGGVVGDRGVLVPGEAQFRQGERVLLFATQDRGRWRVTDMTLGKFRFVTSTLGERVLVRDMEDVVGWDREGRVHDEKVRREDGFLRFVEARSKGRAAPAEDYVVDAREVVLRPDETEQQYAIGTNAAPFPASTYSDWVNNQPTRWPNITSGIVFYKRSDTNVAGAADGGVSVIQNGLAAWTNECNSVIDLRYGGQIARASANHDSTNVVEFNDPQGRVAGSWGGSGTIAITFISFAGTHSFQGSVWLNITDADVVFQDNYSAANAAFASGMTHELGHGLGFRHSNAHYNGGGACNASIEECTSAAIMNSSVGAAYGFTLQTFDINAAQALYPGGTCGGPAPGPAAANDFNGDGRADILWRHQGTGENYVWFMNGGVQIGGGALARVTDLNWRIAGAGDFNRDGRTDIVWRNSATGANLIWYMNGMVQASTGFLPSVTDLGWDIAGVGDFDRDGYPDLLWRHRFSGQNIIWLMTNNAQRTTVVLQTLADTNWRIEGVGDLTADGNADIIWRNAATGENYVWTMSGTTRVGGAGLQSVAGAWDIEAIADYDGDGRLDFAWRNYSTGEDYMWFLTGINLKGTAFLPRISDVNWRMAGPR